MSLKYEKQSELEKIFYDFMNYYKYKNSYWHKPQHPHYKHCNCNCKMPHNHHKVPYSTLPYYFMTPYNQKEDYDVPYYEDGRSTKVLTPANNCDINETYPIVYTPNPEAYEDMNNVIRKNMDPEESEVLYYKAMFNNLNKSFTPYVEQIIKNNDYPGSPINDKYFTREYLQQLISDILEISKENPKLVNYIEDLDPKVKELVRSMVEALLLGELFLVHRPMTELNDKNLTPMPYNTPSPRVNSTEQQITENLNVKGNNSKTQYFSN